MSHRILVTPHDAVTEVAFENEPNNFATVALIRELADALQTLDGEARCRAIVLTSRGKPFCAGANLAVTAGGGVDGQSADPIREFYNEALRLFATKKPIVAAIQGAAVGAGLGLALAADFRVAAPEARFVANFTRLGFHPGFGLSQTLPRLIGAQRAALMLMTGRRIDAKIAHGWGLVDELATSGQALETAHRLAAEIAECAPLSLIATRATLRPTLHDEVAAAMVKEHAEQAKLRDTEDFAEGVRAVAERRPGRFTGR
jgi:enoyl-CoA hydratase/carnithine racemase